MEGEEEVTLTTPVKVVLPVPEGINPALLMLLHYDEYQMDWEMIVPYVYQEGTQWYMTFVAGSFSDFAVAHKVSVIKDYSNEGIWVTLDPHQNAAADQLFLCAIYNEAGQMLGTTTVNGDAFVKLGGKISEAYEVKVFTTSANGSWKPLFGAETIPLSSVN